MRWFRSNGGRAAWLALFALACQFVLTFGHVHLGSAGVISSVSAISADAADGSAGEPSSPAQRTPTGLVRDFCAVCNHIGLASALVLPVSPAAIPPIAFIQEFAMAAGGIWRRLTRPVPFQRPRPSPRLICRPERLHGRFHRLNAPFSSTRSGADPSTRAAVSRVSAKSITR